MPTLEIRHCIICEGVRQEIGNKLSILGFYGVTPDAEILIEQLGIGIPLTFLFKRHPKSTGKHTAETVLLNPDRSTLVFTPTGEVTFKEGELGYLALTFALLSFEQLGAHTIRLSMDQKEIFETTFSVRLSDPSSFHSNV